MVLIAILFPGLSFLLRGRLLRAVVAVILQIIALFTFVFFGSGIILWALLACWAVVSYNNAKTRKQHKQLLKTLRIHQRQMAKG